MPTLHPIPTTIPLELFLLAIVILWPGACAAIARLGGWSALASAHRWDDAFEGERWRFQSARLRWGMNYGNCLTVGANSKGFYLAILFLFRVGHPPLFIPWADISVHETQRWGFRLLEFRFRRAPEILLRVSVRLGQRIAAAAGRSWPGEGGQGP